MIQGIRPLGAVADARPAPATGRGTDFAALLHTAPQTSTSAQTAATTAAAGLLALQELLPTGTSHGAGARNTKAPSVRRLLSGLRELQLGLIDGHDIASCLDRLADALTRLPPDTGGPDAGHLGALRLRVRVELARHGRA